MSVPGRLLVAAVLGFFAAAGAQAQTRLDGAHAEGIVDKPLLTSAIDLSLARPMALPRIDGWVDAAAAMQLAQQNKPSQPTIDMKDTGNPSVAPIKWAGLVMYTISDTQFEYCTGQFIAPRVVLTAGHCVKDIDKNAWNDVSKMSFILQFQNGEGSHVYKVLCTATLDAYSHPSNYSKLSKGDQQNADMVAHESDYAMMLVDSDSLTGTMPYQTDWKGKWLGATRIGYPGDVLNGEVIQQAHGIVFFADAVPIFTNNGQTQSFPNLVVHWQRNTKLTQGSSGGAWIANFDPDEGKGNNVAITVSSFIMTDFAGAIFGPYLTGNNVSALLQYTQKGCKA